MYLLTNSLCFFLTASKDPVILCVLKHICTIKSIFLVMQSQRAVHKDIHIINYDNPFD